MAQHKERGILWTEDAYSFKTIADICQKCFGKDANYRIQRSFFHVADDRMLWCPKLAIELPDGSRWRSLAAGSMSCPLTGM